MANHPIMNRCVFKMTKDGVRKIKDNDCPMCAKEPSNNGELCGECEAYCNSICFETEGLVDLVTGKECNSDAS